MSIVAIAIPTYRRPHGLQDLLQSLAGLRTAHDITVIVGDNDAERREGWQRAADIRDHGYRWRLQPIVIEARGISQARNALIDACLQDPYIEHVVMLDDDEVADPGWLDEMLKTQAATGADIVGGRLNRNFDQPPPSWTHGIPFLSCKTRGASGAVDLVDSSGNILFTRDCLTRAARPVFDPAFGITGGEDKEALTRLRRAGARFAWADRAVVTEQIPASRMTEQWVLQRAFRIGNSDMRVLLRHRTSLFDVLLEIAKSVAIILCAPVAWLLSSANAGRRIRIKMMIWRAAGKLATLGGLAYREYAVTHGR